MRKECEDGAKRLKGIMTNIYGEIKRVMQQSNGNVSWSRLSVLIAGGRDQVQPVGSHALRREFMRRDDFRYASLLSNAFLCGRFTHF